MIQLDERFSSQRLTLRLVTEADCGPVYVGWLADPEVNRYLETRFTTHSETDIRAFVRDQLAHSHSWLFAMVLTAGKQHVGNIKIGPINPHHKYADVSYFIGDRSCWGQGLATEAIGLVTRIGFERLELNRLQAGVYSGNVASAKALIKNGFQKEGRFRKQLQGSAGWEDHLWFGLLAEEWRVQPNAVPATGTSSTTKIRLAEPPETPGLDSAVTRR